MSKLNWEKLNRYDKLRRAPLFGSSLGSAKAAKQRSRTVNRAWLAKFPGECANCHGRFNAGVSIRFNAQQKIVHGFGCPKKKTKGTSPLAG